MDIHSSDAAHISVHSNQSKNQTALMEVNGERFVTLLTVSKPRPHSIHVDKAAGTDGDRNHA